MRQKTSILVLLGILILSSWQVVQLVHATGTTLTVNGNDDASDINAGDGICDTDNGQAGDQCSLRAAIEELNALGPDTTPHRIEFNISGTGPFTITPGTPLPDIVVPVEIDGETQPGAACPSGSSIADLQIILDGRNAGVNTDGLVLTTFNSDGSTIRGLVIGYFDGYGLKMLFSDENRVRCNHIGLNADGITPMGNRDGIFVGGDNNIIGGNNSHAARNIISANQFRGIYITGDENRVSNNFIGTTANGMNDLGNGSRGIRLEIGTGNQIGGTTPIARNVISGNDSDGIEIYAAIDSLILGNYIGVARDGTTPLSNTSDGIHVFSQASDNMIGGINANEGNIIANNLRGIVLRESGGLTPFQIQIRGNAIYDNAVLGIDLGNDNVDVNDPGDLDGEENEHQNYPVLTAVANTLTINGTLNSQPNTQYTVDLYRNESCDSSGHGEGREYLLTELVTTDGNGDAAFTVTATGASDGNTITATATDPNGNTSEFSACAPIALEQAPTPTATSTATVTPEVTSTPDPSSPENYLYLPVALK